MFTFGRNTKTATYGAIIDIGSGSVGVGILKSDYRAELPEILFSHREYMRVVKSGHDSEERLRAMREALFSATLTLSKTGLLTLKAHDTDARIGRILVTCSSPWAHTVSRNVLYEHDEADKITKSLIQDLISNAETEIKETLEESAIAGSAGLQVVERATVNIRVNGYSVQDAIGLKGTTVELSHITGLVPEEILVAVNEVQEKILTDTDLSVHTYMLVIYCVLRDLFPKTDTLCIIDVTGETTEIGVVEEGVLVETVHAPYGSNTLLRNISQETGGSIEDTISMLRAYDENTAKAQVGKAINEHLAGYDDTIAEAIHDLHAHQQLPRTLVVTALPQLEHLFRNRIPQIAKGVTDDTYTTLEFQKGVLDQIASKENADTFITLASRFFHKLHGCGEIDTR